MDWPERCGPHTPDDRKKGPREPDRAALCATQSPLVRWCRNLRIRGQPRVDHVPSRKTQPHFHLMAALTPQNFDRLAKAMMERHHVGYARAHGMLGELKLQLICGEEI